MVVLIEESSQLPISWRPKSIKPAIFMFSDELKSLGVFYTPLLYSHISFRIVPIYCIKGRWTHFSLLPPGKQRLEFNLSQISLSFYGVVKAHLQTLCRSFTFLPPTSIQTWVNVFLCQSNSGRWKWKSFFSFPEKLDCKKLSV